MSKDINIQSDIQDEKIQKKEWTSPVLGVIDFKETSGGFGSLSDGTTSAASVATGPI